MANPTNTKRKIVMPDQQPKHRPADKQHREAELVDVSVDSKLDLGLNEHEATHNEAYVAVVPDAIKPEDRPDEENPKSTVEIAVEGAARKALLQDEGNVELEADRQEAIDKASREGRLTIQLQEPPAEDEVFTDEVMHDNGAFSEGEAKQAIKAQKSESGKVYFVSSSKEMNATILAAGKEYRPRWNDGETHFVWTVDKEDADAFARHSLVQHGKIVRAIG